MLITKTLIDDSFANAVKIDMGSDKYAFSSKSAVGPSMSTVIGSGETARAPTISLSLGIAAGDNSSTNPKKRTIKLTI